MTIGLVGDFDPEVMAHQAIPIALELAAEQLKLKVEYEWVPTEQIVAKSRISRFSGLWCVPASPYRNEIGALLAIRYAREKPLPFLGTCGGFQHAVIEYARHVLGWSDAEHAETVPDAPRAVITPLVCSLVEATQIVRLAPGTRISAAYRSPETTETYRCRYGLNPEVRKALFNGVLREAAHDETGDVRAIELDGHPFFVATLFQPERSALWGQSSKLVEAFVEACGA